MAGSAAAAVALTVVTIGGCGGQRPAAPPPTASGPPPATTAARLGVPGAVLDVVTQVRAVAGNRVDEPVSWVRTTYAAYRRLLPLVGGTGAAASPAPAAAAAEVYVIQLVGDFAALGSTGRRFPVTVVVTPAELPMSAAEDVQQSDQVLPLGELGPVSSFSTS